MTTRAREGMTIPPWDFGSPAAAPLGLPMCQNRYAVPTWSYAMEKLRPSRIIEIGTYSGGFAVALGVHAQMLGAMLVTYDIVKPDERLASLMRALEIVIVTADIFDQAVDVMALMQKPGTTIVLCDGGNKPRELATFAAALKPGDIIAAHDYCPPDGPQADEVYWPCGEIAKSDGDAVAEAFDLEPFMQEHFDKAGWLAYRKRGDIAP